MVNKNLYQYIYPHSVAIIGASERKGSIGHTTLINFKNLNYKGNVFPVNPRYDEVEGYPCYPSLAAIPDEIDVVLIAVASHLVENAIQDCIIKKVKFVVIFSSGFAEKGQEGLEKQNKLLELCRENGIRVVGPNTAGAYNIKDKVVLSFTQGSTLNLISGDVGIVSQSGATGILVISTALDEKVGFTYMLTSGNQMDLNTLDFMDFLVEDKDTNVIASYFEGVPDGLRLREIADKAIEKHKPIIALKTGKSKAGQKAALSHTASLTGSSKVFEMVAKRHGLTLVNDMEELVDAMKAFRSGKRPKGNRVATMVMSGATGIMVADRIEEMDLKMAKLSQITQDQLLEVVPSYCSVLNPVDLGQTMLDNPIIYTHSIKTLTDSDEVDLLLLQLPFGVDAGGLKFAEDVVELAKETEKPIIVMTTGAEGQLGPVRKYLNENNVPAYSSIKSAVQAAYYLVNYENAYNTKKNQFSTIKEDGLENRVVFKNESSVTEPQVKNIFKQINIPVPNGVVVKDVNELIAQSKKLNYPLVAKIVSPDIPHKSDAGGVIFPIKDESSLVEAFEDIFSNVRAYSPDAEIEGILIEEMVQGPCLETIIGVRKDPIFGPVILCGLGGIYVEVMKDVSQSLAPISEKEALEMIQQLKSYPLFTGIRNGLTYDVAAFAQTLERVSQLAVSLDGDWTDIEINPLIVLEEGQGVMALDGLITTPVQGEKRKEYVHE